MALTSLAAEYRIPKREITAEVTILAHLAGVAGFFLQPRAQKLTVRFFLNERAQLHEGAERLSDLLNGPGEFLPAVEPPRKVILLNKDALMVLTVSPLVEFPQEGSSHGAHAPEGGTEVQAEFVLQDGSEVKGVVGVVMPQGKGRLLDFLNSPERFFVIRDGDRVQLVNKKSIVRVSMGDREVGR